MAVKKQENIGNKVSALQYIRTIYLSLAAIIGLICFIIGASGAIKLALNHWFPSDDYSYYAPYDKNSCEILVVDGKEQKRSDNEIENCKLELDQYQQKQNKNNYNRQLTDALSLTLVGFPIWLLHFWLIQLDWKKRNRV